MDKERERVIVGKKMETKGVSGNLLDVLLSQNSHIILHRRAMGPQQPSSSPSVESSERVEERTET